MTRACGTSTQPPKPELILRKVPTLILKMGTFLEINFSGEREVLGEGRRSTSRRSGVVRGEPVVWIQPLQHG
jgi:hypothetical protein